MSNTDESIRKYRKQINRNGWMARLHKWTTGTEPSFVGYCPFFWTTWIFVLLSPLTALRKGFLAACELIGSFFETDAVEGTELENKYIPDDHRKEAILGLIQKSGITPVPEETSWTFKDRLHSKGFYGTISYSDAEWIVSTPDWQRQCELAIGRLQIARAAAARQAEKNQKFAEKREKVVSFLRYFVKPVLALSALFVAYLAYKFVMWILSAVTWAGFVYAVTQLGVAVLFVGAAFLIVAGIGKIFSRAKAKLDTIPEPEAERKPHIFDKAINGIANGLSFIKETVKMTYKKECPLIEWGDETKSIERRK